MTRNAAVIVLLPVANPDPVYFHEALESLARQTFSDFQVLVLEEGTEPRALDSLRKLDDDRFRHRHHRHRTSLAEQLNRGLAEAEADWIARMDADDVCEPDRLERQMDLANADRAANVIGSQIRLIGPDGRVLGTRRYPETHDEIVRAMTFFNPIAHPSVIYRREPVVRAGGYQPGQWNAAQDYDLWSRLARGGARFANHPDPLLRYRVHPAATKQARLRPTLHATIEVKQRYWKSQMSAKARLRLLGERFLLHLPPSLVFRLFMKHAVHQEDRQK